MSGNSLGKFFYQSASKYYDYLKSNFKSEVSIKIKKVERIENKQYCLYFESKVSSIEFCSAIEIERERFLIETNWLFNFDYYSVCIEIPHTKLENKLVSSRQIALKLDYSVLVRRVADAFKEHTSLHLPKTPTSSLHSPEFEGVNFTVEQTNAINTALTSPISYIWGPAGSGKTRYVLAYSVICLMKKFLSEKSSKKKRILITAPTNVALENALLSVIPIAEHWGIPRTEFWRCGIPSKDFERVYPECCKNENQRKIRSNLLQKRNFLESCLRNACILIKFYDLEDRLFHYQQVKISLQNTQSEIDELKLQIKELEQENIKLEILIDQTNYDITLMMQAKKTWSYRIIRFIKRDKHKFEEALINQRSKSENYVKKLNETSKRLSPLNQELMSLTDELNSLRKYLIRCEMEIKDIAEKTIPNYGGDDFFALENKIKEQKEKSLDNIKGIQNLYDKELHTLDFSSPENAYNATTSLSEQLQIIDGELDKVEIAYSGKSASIITTTLDGFASYGSKDFEHIFLDEACYACVAKTAMLFLCKKPITFLGDHKQLPPVSEISEEELRQTEYKDFFIWSQQGIYAADLIQNGIEKSYKNYIDAANEIPSVPVYQALSETHRYGENLAYILDKHIYQNGFHSAVTSNTEILIIDVTRKKAEGNRENVNEANKIQFYLAKNPQADYVILTPYRNQVKLIKSILPEEEKEKVLTVHKSQGQEWETVIFSVTDTKDMYFTNTQNPSSQAKQILNTAISRAKQKLIMVCDVSYWKEQENQLITDLIKIGSTL